MTVTFKEGAATSALEVRERLVEALELDLVGPWPGHVLEKELLPIERRPSNWYLTGFLVPKTAAPDQRRDEDEDDDAADVEERQGLPEESAEERKAAKKGFFPSSMGLSGLVSADAGELTVTVRWGDYVRDTWRGEEADRKPRPVWRRIPGEVPVTLALGQAKKASPVPVPGSDGLVLYLHERAVDLGPESGITELPAGTRSVSVFLVNEREPSEDEPDLSYAFQPSLEVTGTVPFVPRPDLRGSLATEPDERAADLHYADTCEYATGHGVSADWDLIDNTCFTLRTRWIPGAEVEKTDTVVLPGAELSMGALGAMTDGAQVTAALLPLVEQYGTWLDGQVALAEDLKGARKETAEELIAAARFAAKRIRKGIEVLAVDEEALDAFRVANRAVNAALRRRLGIDAPAWKPFQLAFVLLNLPGVADPADPDRETVDLLFFPTGGGKTEAYLGLAAFTMVLRRLRHPDDAHLGGAGVSVVMRYTLRLLTLDQLSRAAGLVCALELEREQDPERYGEWPFEIGLWVGKAATPNRMGAKADGLSDTARTLVRQYKDNAKYKRIPIPLEDCPWCGTHFGPDSFELRPNDDHPKRLRICCTNLECDFIGDRPLPIVAVDDELYRRLPAFLIATVDKFASLPWVGSSGALLGGASRADADGFYGAAETGIGKVLGQPLPPPDLVIQDELHLISGPLGTMAGLYETAIEGLCVREIDGRAVKPKIVASTATVRRAPAQVQALFGRAQTEIFPPPGVGRRDSFFAQVVTVDVAPARRYIGVAAQGRNPKVVMRRVWLALMSAAERCYRDAGGHHNHENPADPYMTVLGYFNSLRELGGARRILEEELPNTIKAYGSHRRVGFDPGYFQDRATLREPVELTSRVPTDKVAEARRRLGLGSHEKERVDTAIATNMISVGLDIPRLGLMGVLGQPKTTAEYIQATSRVGRRDSSPGLVVTVLNIHRPRDRSHYERFRHFHATFYRSVEVASVTPFSARALDRGLAGAAMAMARHAEPMLTPPKGAEHLKDVRVKLEARLLALFDARLGEQSMGKDELEERRASVRHRIIGLLDDWASVTAYYAPDGIDFQYQRYELKSVKPLLREMLDTEFVVPQQRTFRVNRSLRDVEPSVNLFIQEPINGKPMPAKKAKS
jgi:hypothetical protein